MFFEIPIHADLDKKLRTQLIEEIFGGPNRQRIYIFFGLTPIITEDDIRPASAVNIVRRTIGDTRLLNKVSPVERTQIERYKP